MTVHELVLEHIANNHQATLELMELLAANFPALLKGIDSIANEHLRVNKEIQAKYMAAHKLEIRQKEKAMKEETGVMIMKEGKAWGVTYEDGRSKSYGWVEPEIAPIHNPEFCKKTTDATYPGSYLIDELKTGKLVKVKRFTTVEIDT